MYCRMCGNLIDDTDQKCKICGAPTETYSKPIIPVEKTEAAEEFEEVVFNPPFEDEKAENLKFTFLDEKDLNEKEEVAAEPKSEPNPAQKAEDLEIPMEKSEPVIQKKTTEEFSWNVHEFPKDSEKKSEDIEFDWKTGRTADKTEIEMQLFDEINQSKLNLQETGGDKFFTFSKKNEEFQELLDKEYEKVKQRSEPLHMDRALADLDQSLETSNSQETKSKENEIPKEAPEETPKETPEETPKETPEETPKEDIKIEEAEEMLTAKNLFFGEEIIKDNSEIKKTLERSIIEEQQQEIAAISLVKEELSHEEETPVPERHELKREIKENVELAKPGPETMEQKYAEYEALVKADEEEDEQEPKKYFGKIVFTIVAIIIIAEVSILGIKFFAPDSNAAAAMSSFQTKVFETFTGILDKTGGSDSDADKDKEEEQTKAPVEKEAPKETEKPVVKEPEKTIPEPDPNPVADKNALVTSQLGNNVNIVSVKAGTLGFNKEHDYGISDLNTSQPIKNNIWVTSEDGKTKYYDGSVAGTIIAFDSQWIDYVSGKNKSALDLLKKDSKAYQNTIAFSKIGKIKETFKLLEIGEIRQGENGFYVWAHEEIEITENGVTRANSYNWIYYLEPIDGTMKIVNYYKVK